MCVCLFKKPDVCGCVCVFFHQKNDDTTLDNYNIYLLSILSPQGFGAQKNARCSTPCTKLVSRRESRLPRGFRPERTFASTPEAGNHRHERSVRVGEGGIGQRNTWIQRPSVPVCCWPEQPLKVLGFRPLPHCAAPVFPDGFHPLVFGTKSPEVR